MPTNNDINLTSGYITWDGVKISDITSVNLVADEWPKDESSENYVSNIIENKDTSFTMEATFYWPKKFGKMTSRWYRRFFGVDLLMKKFPKKKNRRSIRFKRRRREWRRMTTLW